MQIKLVDIVLMLIKIAKVANLIQVKIIGYVYNVINWVNTNWFQLTKHNVWWNVKQVNYLDFKQRL